MNTLVKAEIWTIARTDQGNAVLIRPLGSEIAIPIFIGQLETQSILIGFGDVSIPRPLTHDLMLALIERLGADILRIEINDLRDGTFYARLILSGTAAMGPGEFVLDARPSDALALAVRRKCPVYIAENVVDAAGVAVNLIVDAAAIDNPAALTNPDTEEPASDDSGLFTRLGYSSAEREILQAELEQAVAAEEYERAAKIRDRLAALNHNPR